MQPDLTWIAVAALCIFALVRLIKGDTFVTVLGSFGLPPIPARVLPWLVLVLGAISAVLDAKVTGVSWQQAAMQGVLSAFSAITGHELVIESLRKGKEIGAGKSGPGGAGTIVGVLGIVFFTLLSACSSFGQAVSNSCVAVKLADGACALVETPNPDGGAPIMVKLTGDELRAHAAKKIQHDAKDGGL